MKPTNRPAVAGRPRRLATRLLSPLAVVCVLVGGALLTAPAAQAAPSKSFVQSQQWWVARLGLHVVWPISKGAGVTVAVLDSGIQGSFGDLQGAIVPGFDATRGGNGETDTDPAMHGTRIADEIAGRGNGFGLLGIAPAAKVMPVVIPTQGGDTETVTALNRLVAMPHPPQVVNMSFAAPEACPNDLQTAVARAVAKGMILIAGAGNDGTSGNSSEWPANCAGVIAVGAVDNNGNAWSDTERQPYVSLAGPGVHMIGYSSQYSAGYGYADGTSDATAMVSGVFALVRSHFPSMPSRELVARVLYTTHQFQGAPHTRNNSTGYGVAVPYNALTKSVPANAPNPVYDALDKQQKPSSAPTNGGGAGTSTEAGAPSGPTTLTPVGSAGGGGGGGSDTGLIVGIVAAVVVVALIVVLLIARQRRSRASYGGPFPGGPPPPGPGSIS